MKKKYFLGWKNLKWFIEEIGKIYSTKPSFFSKKRIESGVAFVIAQWGMIFFLIEHHARITMGEFLLWAAAQFAVSGYILNKIESNKKANRSDANECDVCHSEPCACKMI